MTNVHSIADLGTALNGLRVSRLIIGAHGNANGAQLGNPGVAASMFNAANMDAPVNAGSRTVIADAMVDGGAIELQACNCGNGAAAQNNMQELANIFSCWVTAPDNFTQTWNDISVTWVTKRPE